MAVMAPMSAAIPAPVTLTAPFAVPVEADPEAPVVLAAAPATLAELDVAVVNPLAVAAAAPEVDAAAAVPPMGAVDWPSISACTLELKVPDIPLMLKGKSVDCRNKMTDKNIRKFGGEGKSRVGRGG